MNGKTVIQLDENGIVIGTTVADESPLEPGVYLLPARTIDVEIPEIPEGKFAMWDGDKFIFEDIPPVPLEQPAVTNMSAGMEVPAPESIEIASVTMRQARLALHRSGLLSKVSEAIESITDPDEKQIAKIEWEYAQTVDKYSNWVQNLVVSLNLSNEDLTNLFELANTL